MRKNEGPAGRRRLPIGARVFAETAVVLVIVGLAAGWFHSAKKARGSASSTLASPKSSSTTSSRSHTTATTRPQRPDVLGDWNVLTSTGGVLTLSTTVRISIEGLSGGSDCATAVNNALTDAKQLVRTSALLVHDPGSDRAAAPLVVGGQPMTDAVGTACTLSGGVSQSIGTATWTVDGSVTSIGSEQDATLTRTVYVSFNRASKRCQFNKGDWIWIPPLAVSKASAITGPIELDPSVVWSSANPASQDGQPKVSCA